jgi:hypothetical protein
MKKNPGSEHQLVEEEFFQEYFYNFLKAESGLF